MLALMLPQSPNCLGLVYLLVRHGANIVNHTDHLISVFGEEKTNLLTPRIDTIFWKLRQMLNEAKENEQGKGIQ